MQSGAEQWRWLRRTISNLDGSMFAIGTPTSHNQVLSIPILFNAPIFYSAIKETKTSCTAKTGTRAVSNGAILLLRTTIFCVPTFDQGDMKNEKDPSLFMVSQVMFISSCSNNSTIFILPQQSYFQFDIRPKSGLVQPKNIYYIYET